MTRAKRRRVVVVTGARAEYGLLRWLMGDLRADPRAEMRVVATGAHLSDAHGGTIDEIAGDGFEVAAAVPLNLHDDAPTTVAGAIGAATAGMAAELERLRPEIMVVLGDRYEILGAATAATVQRIPIAHLHGGETTEGAFDEAFRHAITKMSHLHFTAAEPYRQRVIQLGEDPARVWNVGALGVEAVTRIERLSRATLEERLGGFELGERPLVVTYHPATLDVSGPGAAVSALTAALDEFPDRQVVVTGSNADPGGRLVDELFASWAGRQSQRVRCVPNLGQQGYLSLVALAGAVVGNSSSGIIEAPAVGVPTVNLGSRQAGRLRAPSVLDCAEERPAIVAALTAALGSAWPPSSPYGSGGASARIRDILVTEPLDGILRKRFFDLRHPAAG